MSRSDKRVGLSVRLPFQTSVVAWVDLLGYGSQLTNANFNPMHADSIKAHKRLREFHSIVADHSVKRFPSLVMNDGAIMYRDVSYRTNTVTADFILRAWRLFNNINLVDKSNGHPGARMVIATGFRHLGRRAGLDRTRGQLESILKRVKANSITYEQAIYEAMNAQPVFDVVPHLQSNYAFTKAYAAESSGKKGGLPGSKLYVDSSLFNLHASGRKNVTLTSPISWKDSRLGLQADFHEILFVQDRKFDSFAPAFFRNGLELAQVLTNDADVLSKLRAAKKP